MEIVDGSTIGEEEWKKGPKMDSQTTYHHNEAEVTKYRIFTDKTTTSKTATTKTSLETNWSHASYATTTTTIFPFYKSTATIATTTIARRKSETKTISN